MDYRIYLKTKPEIISEKIDAIDKTDLEGLKKYKESLENLYKNNDAQKDYSYMLTPYLVEIPDLKKGYAIIEGIFLEPIEYTDEDISKLTDLRTVIENSTPICKKIMINDGILDESYDSVALCKYEDIILLYDKNCIMPLPLDDKKIEYQFGEAVNIDFNYDFVYSVFEKQLKNGIDILEMIKKSR